MAENDYGSMLGSYLFNPYVQFGLGLLAGNTGSTKGEAFSNAMQGGLAGANAAQRSMAYANQVKAQQDHYEMLKKTRENQIAIAQKMLQNPNLTEDQKMMWEMAAAGDLESGVKYFNAASDASYQRAMMEGKLAKMSGGGGDSGGTILNNPIIGSPQALGKGVPSTEVPMFLRGWRTDSKGNLYDPLGVKSSDNEKEWYREQMNYLRAGQPDKVSDFPVWNSAQKAKSDPNMMIYPKDFKNWVNPQTGEAINKPMTQMEAYNNNIVYATDKQVGDLKAVRGSLATLQEAQDTLFGEDGIYTKISGFSSPDILDRTVGSLQVMGAAAGLGDDQWQRNVRRYGSLKDSYLSQLSRMAGQVGTLTDRDVDLVGDLWPDPTPKIGLKTFRVIAGDAEEARQRFITIRNYLKSKGVDPEAVLGNISIPSDNFKAAKDKIEAAGVTNIVIGKPK